MIKIVDLNQRMVGDEGAHRVAGHLIVPFGSTANNLIGVAGARDPQILARAVGLDGEHNLQADGVPFTINNGGSDDWERVRAWRTLPVVKNDSLLPHVDIPSHMGAGAGRQRILGHVRYHTKRSAFVTRVKDTMDAILPSSKEQGGGHRTILHVHFVTTLVGGTGAGCLPIGVLDTISAIHEQVPGIQVFATAHLIGTTCFRGLSREKESKMHRNTDGLLAELIHLQDTGNLRDFAKKMEVFLPEARDRLLDEVVEYFGSNSRNVRFSLPDTFERVDANIRASFNPAWSWLHIEREECNRNGRADLTLQHIVTNSQASLATIPMALPKWFASRWIVGAVGSLLAKADLSELAGEVSEALEALNVEGAFKKSTQRAYQQLGSGVLEDAKAMANQQGEVEDLTAGLEKKLNKLRDLVVEYFQPRANKRVNRWVLDLSARHSSLLKLGALVKQVADRLGEGKLRAEAEAQRLEKATEDGPIKKRRFLRSHSGLLEFVEARIEASRFKMAAEVIAVYMEAARAWVEKFEALAEGLRIAAIRARKEVGKCEDALRGDSASVVRPAEIAALPASLQRFLVERGDAPPAVSLSAILEEDGVQWLTESGDQVAHSLRRQLAAESVTSFVSAFQLSFDSEAFVRDKLRSLGGTSPLVPALIPPNEDEQTVVVAAGADFRCVERFLVANPRLSHQLELVRGTELGSILVVRGVHHAPIDAMTARAPAARAVAEFRREYPNLGKIPVSAVQTCPMLPLDAVEASCGALLPAHDAGSPGNEGASAIDSTPAGPRNGRARLGQSNA